jgi:2-oxoglutarate dehydrogenase E2 component (dihydrolipoamide succinyltransferase)
MADVTLPQLGETVTEGTITRWFKQVGESVAVDEPLFEVSTDKVDTEVPSPVAGTLTEIRVNEGDTVPVGAVIAVVGDGAEATPEATPAEPAATAADVAGSQAPAEAPPAEAPPAEPAPAEPAPAEPAPAEAPEPEPVADAPEPAAEAAPTPDGQAEPASDARLLSPVVRRLVNEHALDPGQIQGTGAGGRITREDVVAHIERTGAQRAPAAEAVAEPAAPAPAAVASPAPTTAPPAAPAPAGAAPAAPPDARDEPVRLSKIRKLTGDHMVMSLATSPHAFSVVEIDYANVDRVRQRLKDEWKASEGFGLTYLPFISRAVIDALAEYPHLNASVGDGELVVHKFVDLGIAVDLDYQGLLVPVIREADSKRLRAIAREISDLASRAKSRRLSPDEIQGGTFTISNNGSAGSVLTAAIINQPQVAILSTDAIVKKPVVVGLPDGSDTIAIHPVGNLAMSWDHRAFDGAYAAGFLVKVKQLLETRDWSAEL